jgi:hypothetical protein
METVNKCPKCGYDSQDPFMECPSCGVVIDKFLERERGDFDPLSPSVESDMQATKYGSRFPKGIIIFIGLLAIGGWWGWTRIHRKPDMMLSGTQGMVEKISNGEKINIEDYVIEGGYTVFVFYADW